MNVISFEYRYKVHELKFSYFAIFKRANIKKDNLVARVIVSVNFSSSITAHDGRRWMRSFTRGGGHKSTRALTNTLGSPTLSDTCALTYKRKGGNIMKPPLTNGRECVCVCGREEDETTATRPLLPSASPSLFHIYPFAPYT